jgi:hypothetical protein
MLSVCAANLIALALIIVEEAHDKNAALGLPKEICERCAATQMPRVLS